MTTSDCIRLESPLHVLKCTTHVRINYHHLHANVERQHFTRLSKQRTLLVLNLGDDLDILAAVIIKVLFFVNSHQHLQKHAPVRHVCYIVERAAPHPLMQRFRLGMHILAHVYACLRAFKCSVDED